MYWRKTTLKFLPPLEHGARQHQKNSVLKNNKGKIDFWAELLVDERMHTFSYRMPKKLKKNLFSIAQKMEFCVVPKWSFGTHSQTDQISKK